MFTESAEHLGVAVGDHDDAEDDAQGEKSERLDAIKPAKHTSFVI